MAAITLFLAVPGAAHAKGGMLTERGAKNLISQKLSVWSKKGFKTTFSPTADPNTLKYRAVSKEHGPGGATYIMIGDIDMRENGPQKGLDRVRVDHEEE
jgi:hypothetical protein